MMFFLLSIVALNPSAGYPVETVAMCEYHTFHDSDAKPIFSQLVFWGWCGQTDGYRVIDWRMAKEPPVVERRGGSWQVMFADQRGTRVVRAGVYRVTNTQSDVEVEDRAVLPREQRRGLAPRRTRAGKP
jgi:hypothetical protein